MSQVKAVQYRKWSPLANDPQTANDPHYRKWSCEK